MGSARTLMEEVEVPSFLAKANAREGRPNARIYAHPEIIAIVGNVVHFKNLQQGHFLEDGVTCEIPSLTGPATRIRIPSLEAYRWVTTVEDLCTRFKTQFHRWPDGGILEVPEACEPVLEHLFWQHPFQLLSDGRDSMPDDYFGVMRSAVPLEMRNALQCPAFRVAEGAEGVHLHFGHLRKNLSTETKWTIGDEPARPFTYFRNE